MNQPSTSSWLNRVRRRFTVFDVLLLLLGAVLGYAGNALYGDLYLNAIGLIIIAVFLILAVLVIDRLRVHAENEMSRSNAELQVELQKSLTQVHATVAFIPEAKYSVVAEMNGSRPQVYDAATRLARQAKQSILVIGDYSPPPQLGASFDNSPPAHRSEYLSAIETMLEERAKSSDPNLPVLRYRRFIQRPVDVYEAARSRDSMRGSVCLTEADMIGDEQTFDHCRTVLEIARRAKARSTDRRIQVEIRIIPFLPNCLSMLLVDNTEMQFTIPMRTDDPSEDDFAKQGLLGILAVEDRANGTQITSHFLGLFDQLTRFSSAVIATASQSSASVRN